MSSSLLLLLSLSLFWLVAVAATSHGGLHMEEEGGNGCTVSNVSYLKSAINSSEGYNLTSIVINCLQYADNRSTLAFGSISYENIDGSSGRYSVHCSSSSTFLLLSTSEASYSAVRYSCYQCEDNENPCVSNTRCPQYCDQCLSSSECLSCTYVKHNGTCLPPNSTCPNGGTPNAQKGNECECPMNFGGSKCGDCLLHDGDCPYILDSMNCTCVSTCPTNYPYQALFNPESRVPDSVIGSPGTGHHRKRATEEGGDSHGGGSGSSNDTDRTYCVQKPCPNPCSSCSSCGSCGSWRANHDTKICYACAINYCLDCSGIGDCTRCRNGTLLKTTSQPHHCIGFYDYVRELNHEFQEEEDHEREKFKREQLELQIALPIICFFVIVIFILVAIFAHFRYPHVGKDKRHRDPAKRADTNPDTIESRFRPQSTVRYR